MLVLLFRRQQKSYLLGWKCIFYSYEVLACYFWGKKERKKENYAVAVTVRCFVPRLHKPLQTNRKPTGLAVSLENYYSQERQK